MSHNHLSSAARHSFAHTESEHASQILDPRDESTVREIMSRACDILQDKVLCLAPPGSTSEYSSRALSDGARRFDLIGASPICAQLSDAVTRAAQGLGMVASREMHSRNPHTVATHYLTSFAPLNEPLSEDDPILCATWGQFTYAAFHKRLRKKQELYGFFSRRRDIGKLVSPETYNRCYSAGSVALRQTVNAPLPPEAQTNRYHGHCWLNTSPEDTLTGEYPATESSIQAYPVAMWEYAPLLRRAASTEAVDGALNEADDQG